MEKKFIISATSILGFPTYMVSHTDIEDEGNIVKAIKFLNKREKAALYSREEAEALLPHVLLVRNTAVIEEANNGK
jgi:hypothetical protein